MNIQIKYVSLSSEKTFNDPKIKQLIKRKK